MELPRPGEAPPLEYEANKIRLREIRATLAAAITATEQARRAWIQRVMEQRNFAQSFAEGFPGTDDDMHQVAWEYAKQAQAAYEACLGHPGAQDEMTTKLITALRAYISEISQVEALYPQLIRATAKLAPTVRKIEEIETHGFEESDVRRMEKLILTRNRLEDVISTVIAAQNHVLRKSEAMHKAAMVVYWHLHGRNVQLVTSVGKNTEGFADRQIAELCDVDLVEDGDDDGDGNAGPSSSKTTHKG